MANIINQKLGHYLITEKLGEGGMAVVYKAHDDHLEREVAVKVIRKEAFNSEDTGPLLARFSREARALARLTHPNIVGVIDYGQFEEMPYLVMVYLPGGSLRDWMKDRWQAGEPFTYAEAARIVAQIARALDYAHQQGIFHRDVKPNNILLTSSGEPMLTDFGIAKLLEGQSPDTMHLTSTGAGIGTPEYMAPEQWVGKAVPLSDEYALGVVFYELVTGRKPYEADTPAELIIKQATEPLPPPRKFAPHLTAATESIILRALAKKPEERFPSLAAFAGAVEASINSQPERKQPRQGQGKPGKERTPTPPPPTPTPAPEGETTLTPPGEQPRSTIVLPKPEPEPKTARPRWALLAIGSFVLLALAAIGIWQFAPAAFPDQKATLVMAASQETAAARTAEAPTAEPAATATQSPFASENTVGPVNLFNGKRAFSADGRRMAVSMYDKITIYATDSLRVEMEIPVPAEALAVSGDGTLLAAAGKNTITVWDISGSSASVKYTINEYSPGFLGMAFSPAKGRLAAYDQVKLMIFNLDQKGRDEESLYKGGPVTDIAFSPDGTRFAVTRQAGDDPTFGILQVYNVGEWKQPLRDVHAQNGCGAYSAAFSPDNQRLSVAMCDRIETWTGGDMKRVYQPIPVDEPINDLTYTADGNVMAGNRGTGLGVLTLFDMQALAEIDSYPGLAFLTLFDGGEKIAVYMAGSVVLVGR